MTWSLRGSEAGGDHILIEVFIYNTEKVQTVSAHK